MPDRRGFRIAVPLCTAALLTTLLASTGAANEGIEDGGEQTPSAPEGADPGAYETTTSTIPIETEYFDPAVEAPPPPPHPNELEAAVEDFEAATEDVFLRGAQPADPETIEVMQVERELFGLSTDPDLIARLLQETGSANTVREFGFVVSSREAEALRAERLQAEAVDQLVDRLAELEGWAGSRRLNDASGQRRGVELWVTADAQDEAQAILESQSDFVDRAGDVRLDVRTHSWKDMQEASYKLNDALNGQESDISDAERALVADLEAIGTVSVGYSVRHNRLEAGVADVSQAVAQSHSVRTADGATYTEHSYAPGLPVHIEPHATGRDDTGPDNCRRHGCASATRSGLSFNSPSGGCTIGLPIVDGSDRDYTTAGHCGGSNRDLVLQRESGTYPSFYNFARNVGDFTYSGQSNGFYNGSRIDGREVEFANRLVSNRLYSNSADPGRLIVGYRSYASLELDDLVCLTGRHTEFRRCGLITAIGRTFTAGGVTMPDQIFTTYTRAGGDSGAPVMRQNAPAVTVGTHRGVVNGGTFDGNAVFNSVSFLQDIEAGIQLFTSTDRRRDFVLGLYTSGLGRFADSGGYNYFRNTTLSSCTLARARSVAVAILTSSEFRSRYPVGTANGIRNRVEKLYWAGLGRRSDSGGFNHIVDVMVSASNREAEWTTRVFGVVNSSEFSNRVSNGASSVDGRIC